MDIGASNKDADYKPTWAHSTAIEIVVWGIPVIIIGILAWLTWWGSHKKYDPYRPVESDKAPLTVQVIAEQLGCGSSSTQNKTLRLLTKCASQRKLRLLFV